MAIVSLMLTLVLGQGAPPSLEAALRGCTAKKARACFAAGRLTEGPDPIKAIALFDEACALGDMSGCFRVAWLTSDREAPDRLDYARSVKMNTKACDGGMAVACNNLAIQYKHGRGTQRDYAQAAAYWTRGCALGAATACTDLGWLRANGLGGPRDSAAALTAYRNGCVGGDSRGCNNLANLLKSNPGLVDEGQLRALLAAACLRGDGLACSNLGELMRGGRGGAKDPDGAMDFFERGCTLNSRLGCELLARSFATGLGATAQSPERARQSWDRACVLGSVLGCQMVGREATGIIKDSDSQKTIIEEAVNRCDARDADACRRAMVHYGRKGPNQDEAMAEQYGQKACDLGHKPSCEILREYREFRAKRATGAE